MWRDRVEFLNTLDAARREQNRGAGILGVVLLAVFLILAPSYVCFEFVLASNDVGDKLLTIFCATTMLILFFAAITAAQPFRRHGLRCPKCGKSFAAPYLTAVAIGSGRCGVCGTELFALSD